MFFIFVFFWVATAPADEEARSIERQVFVQEEEEPKVVDGVAFGGGSVLLYQNRNSRAT